MDEKHVTFRVTRAEVGTWKHFSVSEFVRGYHNGLCLHVASVSREMSALRAGPEHIFSQDRTFVVFPEHFGPRIEMNPET